MNFKQYCELAKVEYFGNYGQAYYTNDLFKAAGITRQYSDSYLVSVYNGTKHFNSNMKKHFKKPVDVLPIAQFYEEKLDDKFVEDLIDAFGIPKSIERNKKYIAGALAEQVKIFIESDSEDVENVVPTEYQKQQIKKETSNCYIGKPLYTNDSVWVENCGKILVKGFYEKFIHTWVIHNIGKVNWHSRKLVFVNAGDNDIVPTANMLEISIPDTMPNGIVKVAAEFDARGDENKYICKWEMQDADGNNCFPDSRWVFDVTINVVPQFE